MIKHEGLKTRMALLEDNSRILAIYNVGTTKKPCIMCFAIVLLSGIYGSVWQTRSIEIGSLVPMLRIRFSLIWKKSMSQTNWKELWATTCHIIWYLRNKIMHTYDFIMPIDLVQNIIHMFQNYQESMTMIHTIKGKRLTAQINRWHPPEENWISLNSDGGCPITRWMCAQRRQWYSDSLFQENHGKMLSSDQ